MREVIDISQRLKTAPAPLREAVGAWIDDDEDQWRRISEDTNRDLTPLTQQRMQHMALYLWEANLLANRLIELPIAYILAEGVRLVAEDENVQDVLDRFWKHPINNMDLKLTKKVRELAIFGEQCYPAFVNEFSGQVRLGYLDPGAIETVVTDPDNGEQAIGIVTKKDRKGNARRYRVIVNGADQDLFTRRTLEIRDTFDTGECFYFTVNDLSNGRRGRSDLLAQTDWLDAYDQFMFGEMERSAMMRAFMWDVTLKGATKEDVEKRAKEIAPPKPASVRVHNDSEEWKAETPDLKAVDSEASARLFRNHILGGSTIPEVWFGGGGDVNRAAAAEMGDPTFKMFVQRQTYIGYMLETIGVYVIRRSELALSRREPDLHDPIFNFSVQFPEMVPSDTTKYASALQQVTVAVTMAIDRGLLTEETGVRILENISGRLGVEFDAKDEIEKAREESEKRNEHDVFNIPPGDEDVDAGGAPETPSAPATAE